jgi:hypothetical protein
LNNGQDKRDALWDGAHLAMRLCGLGCGASVACVF